MNPHLIITLASREDPRTVLGYFDGSRACFSTDPNRAKPIRPAELPEWPGTSFGAAFHVNRLIYVPSRDG
jgi:hypothetical protein